MFSTSRIPYRIAQEPLDDKETTTPSPGRVLNPRLPERPCKMNATCRDGARPDGLAHYRAAAAGAPHSSASGHSNLDVGDRRQRLLRIRVLRGEGEQRGHS